LRVIEKTKPNPVTVGRIKASELREKKYYVKKMEEVLGPRNTDEDVWPEVGS